MFASLYSLSTPVAALIKLAEDFTPRFEVVGPMVMLDVSGLSNSKVKGVTVDLDAALPDDEA